MDDRKLLRYRNYDNSDIPNFYREHLMLFLLWRNEKTELINVNHKEKFVNNKQTILKEKSLFFQIDQAEIDELMEQIVQHESENIVEEKHSQRF